MILDIKKDEKLKRLQSIIRENPEIIEAYITHKEWTWDEAINHSLEDMSNFISFFNSENKNRFSSLLENYHSDRSTNSYEEGISLIKYFRDTIENKWVWKSFWIDDTKRVDEKNVQNLFKLTHRNSKFDISSEVDNWSWPVDFKISFWAEDITVIEFKLATNSKALPIKQLESYKNANNTYQWLIVVFCFDESEVKKIEKWIRTKKLENAFIIDVSPKKSASKL